MEPASNVEEVWIYPDFCHSSYYLKNSKYGYTKDGSCYIYVCSNCYNEIAEGNSDYDFCEGCDALTNRQDMNISPAGERLCPYCIVDVVSNSPELFANKFVPRGPPLPTIYLGTYQRPKVKENGKITLVYRETGSADWSLAPQIQASNFIREIKTIVEAKLGWLIITRSWPSEMRVMDAELYEIKL